MTPPINTANVLQYTIIPLYNPSGRQYEQQFSLENKSCKSMTYQHLDCFQKREIAILIALMTQVSAIK